MISQNIEKFNSMNNLEVKFISQNEYKLNYILEEIKSFGKVYYNNYKYSFIKIDSSSQNISEIHEKDYKAPKVGIPGIDVNRPKMNVSNIGLDIKGPKIDLPDVDIRGPKIGLPSVDIRGPKIGLPGVDIIGPKIYHVPNISTPQIKINISNSRNYKVNGERENILTKTGEDNNWMGTICIRELINSEENIWKIKILKTQYKYIMVGIAPIDFDINSSIYNYGWYFFCYDSTLYSGPPHNYVHKETNLNKVKDEVKIIMNLSKKTLKFIINNEDKGESYTNIPIDIPLSPAVLIYNKDDSIEILESNYLKINIL